MTNKLKKEIEDETIGSHGDIQFNEWFERLVDEPKDKKGYKKINSGLDKLRKLERNNRYCIKCKKSMYSSNESIWIKNKNYDIHKKCKEENKLYNKKNSY